MDTFRSGFIEESIHSLFDSEGFDASLEAALIEHSAIAAAVVKLAFPRVHNPAARSKRFSAATAFLTDIPHCT